MEIRRQRNRRGKRVEILEGYSPKNSGQEAHVREAAKKMIAVLGPVWEITQRKFKNNFERIMMLFIC